MMRRAAGAGSRGLVPGFCRPLVVAIATLLALATTLPAVSRADDLPAPYGMLIAPHSAGVLVTDLATGASHQIAVMPPVGIAGHAAWSPDGSQIALSRFGRPPGERAGGSDILLVPEVGGSAAPLAEHDADGALL